MINHFARRLATVAAAVVALGTASLLIAAPASAAAPAPRAGHVIPANPPGVPPGYVKRNLYFSELGCEIGGFYGQASGAWGKFVCIPVEASDGSGTDWQLYTDR
jgi:hypothetical protein